jgi:hypothetical protein
MTSGTIASVSDKDSKHVERSEDDIEPSETTPDDRSVERDGTNPRLSEIESLLREP